MRKNGRAQDGDAGQEVRQKRIRRLRGDDDGVRIGGLDSREVARDVGERTCNRRLVLQGAAEAEDHVVGGEGLAVGEGHALAKLEGPTSLAVVLPGGGKVGQDFLLLVLLGQSVEDMSHEGIVRRQIMIVWVDGSRLSAILRDCAHAGALSRQVLATKASMSGWRIECLSGSLGGCFLTNLFSQIKNHENFLTSISLECPCLKS